MVALNWGDLFISSHSKRRRSGEKCKRTSSEPREMYKIMHIKITATIERTENEVRERTHFKLQPIRIPSQYATEKPRAPQGKHQNARRFWYSLLHQNAAAALSVSISPHIYFRIGREGLKIPCVLYKSLQSVGAAAHIGA